MYKEIFLFDFNIKHVSILFKVLNMLIHQNKTEQQSGADFLQGGSSINIRVRRGYFYEDAFDKLSPQNGN